MVVRLLESSDPKPKEGRTGGIARVPKELEPWKRGSPTERQPQR